MPVVLPAVLMVGFTGHRHLSDETTSRARILEFLEARKTGAQRLVCGVTSVAAGADLLFAEACMQLGLPLRILLPMPREQFREDFDAPDWDRVERTLRYAMSVEVTGEGSARDVRYYECGVRTVQECNVLVTLWDGEPSRGVGGTEQIVTFAKAQGRAIHWIHSRAGTVTEFNPEPSPADPELDFLNALPDPEPAPPTGTPGELAGAWLKKIDNGANHASPQTRRLAAIPILCTAAASLLTAVGAVSGHGALFLGGSALGLIALTLPRLLRLNERHVAWARIRTATEVARSHLAFWKTPGIYNAIGPDAIPELSGMLASLNYLKMSEQAGMHADLEDFRRSYREQRVQDQIDYFSRHAALAERRARLLSRVVTIAVLAAQGAIIAVLIQDSGMASISAGNWKPALRLAATIFFQIAAVSGAALAVNDYKRRRRRYRELESRLRDWDRQLQVAQTWPVFLQITGMVERALLAEIFEWRLFIRNNKLRRGI
ncbi:MAG TPA: hypothetical protein VFY29_12040 [Terriglobia bacterium]|nr:hypothetical protein [Terriglobia bacterium]